MAGPLGAQDNLDAALLRLHRLALAATIHAGNGSAPALTATQIRLLTVLGAARDGLNLTATAEALSMSAPSASRLCQRLARDGLVAREAGPGHHILMSLTGKGARTLTAVNRKRVTPLRELIDTLPTRRRAALVRELDHLGRLASERPQAW